MTHASWSLLPARRAWHPDGVVLASGGSDATVRLWDAKTGKELAVLDSHFVGVPSVAWSRDGKTLASGGWDKTIKLWDTGPAK